ncbi:PEP-utilizing enzyme [Ilumatobacter coccineus]|uniref:PEP-utilizing enzyme n=1 Tax=Ilumatobacter coccineus TaxID=467094 RepID=UPI00138B0FE9|nr:PEP-utilizing enzyme [Ilumatobacter coccineus]
MTTSASDSNTWFGDSAIGDRFPAWTRGNAADVFPDPFSPLGQDLVVRQGLCISLRDAYIDIGVLDWDEFENPESPELFAMFGGYLYNPLSLTRLLGARMPGVTPQAIDLAFFDDRDDIPEYEEQPWHQSPKHEAALAESMAWTMSTDSIPELDADKEYAESLRTNRPDLASATDSALLARAREMVPAIQRLFENAMRISSLSSLGPGALGALCEAVGDPTASIRLLAGIDVDSAAPSHAMWELGRVANASEELRAAFEGGPDAVLDTLRASGSDDANDFLARFDEFIATYGSRAQNEYDIMSPSWEVRPRIALAAIDLMRRSDESKAPSVRHDASVAERDRVAAEMREKLAGDEEAAGTFEAAMQSSRLFLSGRERAKTNVVIAINEMRMALREFGRRLVERGVIDKIEKIFMLTDDELSQCRHDPESMKDLIESRWTQFQTLYDREPVFVVNHDVPGLDQMTERNSVAVTQSSAGDVLTGNAGSGGTARGRARVILDASDPLALEPGDILIAPQTDPSWVPLFVPAAGVVVNVGAMGSHAMIVSRELGIPCVASVAEATRLIPDGAIVEVDGSAGTVTIVSLPD